MLLGFIKKLTKRAADFFIQHDLFYDVMLRLFHQPDALIAPLRQKTDQVKEKNEVPVR